MIIGSHNSATFQSASTAMCLCWEWAETQSLSLGEQFDLGVRLFDLRYSQSSGVFYISHTLNTSYNVHDALYELIKRATAANEYIYIRLKRDSSSVPLPTFGTWLPCIMIDDSSLQDFIIPFDGSTLSQFIGKKPTDSHCVILYSDDNTLHEDNLTPQWIFPQLFDTVETWMHGTVAEAVQAITTAKFADNGLPKAIFVDFSSNYPPDIAFKLVWSEVKQIVTEYITEEKIQCVMINCVHDRIMHELRVKKMHPL